jgi:hypothetical protein
MTGFAALAAGLEQTEDGLALAVPESWHQGRTAYGGFSSALALTAALRAAGDRLPPLRSAQLAMIAPVAGKVRVRAKVLRRGRNATWMEARIAGDAGDGFVGNFVFMAPVESALEIDDRPTPPERVAVEEAVPVAASAHTPAFAVHHFEWRHALPQGGKRAEICRWVRLRERGQLDPMVELLLLADALPPGVMPVMPAIVPVSTMHWQVNLLSPAPVTRDGWWLLRSTGDYAKDGCSSQRMGLWNADGVPMLAGTQSIALFG